MDSGYRGLPREISGFYLSSNRYRSFPLHALAGSQLDRIRRRRRISGRWVLLAGVKSLEGESNVLL